MGLASVLKQKLLVNCATSIQPTCDFQNRSSGCSQGANKVPLQVPSLSLWLPFSSLFSEAVRASTAVSRSCYPAQSSISSKCKKGMRLRHTSTDGAWKPGGKCFSLSLTRGSSETRALFLLVVISSVIYLSLTLPSPVSFLPFSLPLSLSFYWGIVDISYISFRCVKWFPICIYCNIINIVSLVNTCSQTFFFLKWELLRITLLASFFLFLQTVLCLC